MKKILMVAILLIASVSIFAQDRVNAKPISILLNKQLNQSTGWMIDKGGQWKSKPNRIPTADIDKILIDYEIYGLGQDNFISYQIGEIKIDDSTYVILVKKYKDGYYRYESIQRGWTPCISVMYDVFSKQEFEKLKDVKFDTKNAVRIKTVCSGNIMYVITNENMMYQIKKHISESKADGFESGELGVLLYPLSKDFKVRFQITTISQYSDEQEIFKSFDTSYYETSIASFNSFIPIVKDKGYTASK
jgi:hypothetical protein